MPPDPRLRKQADQRPYAGQALPRRADLDAGGGPRPRRLLRGQESAAQPRGLLSPSPSLPPNPLTPSQTKIDPDKPNETLGLDLYVDRIVPILKKRGYLSRTIIQSFDWRTLVAIKKRFPETRLAALVQGSTLVPAANGTYTWLGGIDLAEDFGGDWVAAAASLGVEVVSPVHGAPSSMSVNTPGYVPFVTADMVARAHRLQMQVVPWTVWTPPFVAMEVWY